MRIQYGQAGKKMLAEHVQQVTGRDAGAPGQPCQQGDHLAGIVGADRGVGAAAPELGGIQQRIGKTG